MARSSACLSVLPFFLLATGGEPSAPVRKGLETITAHDAKVHVDYLASEALGGRETGERGCEAAAEYLAAQFKHFGIEPFGDEVDGKRGYFQKYPITRSVLEKTSTLVLETAKGTKTLAIGKDFTPLAAPFAGPIPKAVEASKVVDGGSVVVPARDPAASRPRGGGRGQGPPRLEITLPPDSEDAFVLFHVSGVTDRPSGTLTMALFRALSESKARGAILVPSADQSADDWGNAFERSAASATAPRITRSTGTASAPRAQANYPYLCLKSAEMANDLVGGKATFKADAKKEEKSAANVVGRIRGSDPKLADEYVVYSAHYDHVGYEGGKLHPGADDNASGTAALLEIAQAYTSTEAPRRSVIVLSVSGEEKGLWGSDWFAEHPPVPREQLVADLNTDMVGRSMFYGESKPGYMEMTPSKKSEFFNTLAAEAIDLGAQYGFPEMTNGDKYWMRSDHYNFAKHGIPAMFLCNGEHEDYHQPGDTPDKIDGDKIARAARLCFHLGYDTASRDERPHVLGKAASAPAGGK
ncbi:MAG TPA: M28 family peptidase [Planctomycetota bacterium]|nr:M28 family peptidase [Planctomycetota bacterium]